jgi:P4 family phage/plasmid primase-like protien
MGKDKRGLVSVHTASILPVLKKTLHMEEAHIKDAHFVGKHRVWMCHANSPVECPGCGTHKVVCWALTSGELSYRCTTAWCRHPHPRWHVDEATMECVNVEDRVNALERAKEPAKKVKVRTAQVQEMIDLMTVGGSGLATYIYDARFGRDVWTGSVWYHYHEDEHRWKPDKNKMAAHLLVEDVVGTYLRARVEKLDDDEVTAAHRALTVRVGDRSHREKVVRDMETAFFDATFTNKLDSKRTVTVFKNGVYDSEARAFRSGDPLDYATLSTNTTFVHIREKYAERAIMAFLAKIIPSPETLSMVLTSVALAMRGVSTSRFFLWVGCGSNGKSKLANLFRMALGEYAVAIPVSLFTQKRAESGRAMPELSRTSGRRVAFISEPSHNETLNLGIVKEVTGGDAMFTRGLYESGSEIVCGFVPILLCNVLPSVTDTSHGAWRRLVSVTFPTLFVENPTKPHEARMDPYVEESIRIWADLFSTMLATYNQDGDGANLSIPKDCLLTTQEYQSESDFYSEYIHERIIHTGHDYDEVKWTDLWTDFYAWFVLSYGKSHIPKKAEAKKKFQETLNPNPKKGSHKFVGYLIDRSK